jgi:hypothetical protein
MKPCECKTCRIGRAMEMMAGGIEEWLNESCEMEMSLAYLRDEVTEVVALPWWRRKTPRLRKALRAVGPWEAT